MKRGFTYSPPKCPISYIYVDQDVIIAEKPCGLLSVPGKTETDCMEARVRADYPESLTIHRLDMATSGLMVFAHNKNAQRHIGLQFEKRFIRKEYVARVWGLINLNKFNIDLPVKTDWKNRPLQIVCYEKGKSALTKVEMISRGNNSSYLKLKPVTGRTHQLRVHLNSIGHPILGDRMYAHDSAFALANRLMLHATKIKLMRPADGEWIEFNSACPF
jgi:tRNA pseudouridine32 synthase/23S rRNA pseudouridine746 synthase